MEKQTNPVPILEVEDLSVTFRMYERGTRQRDLEVISNLSVQVRQGEVLAVVGSSGSGKSLLAHAILGILPGNASVRGEMRFDGEPLTPRRQQRLRGDKIALVPQSVAYLDPLMHIDKQVQGVRGARQRAREVLRRYRLCERSERMYPFQLSGGMARRVLVSTAVMGDPRLIIADEPTPGLSLDLAAAALQTFRELADNGCGVLLITHDLDLALSAAHRVAVFYAGTTVEVAPAEDFRRGGEALRHPYSRAFFDALPQNAFRPIPGFQPYAGELPAGCLFSPRCPGCTPECKERLPEMRPLRGGTVRCVHAV